MNPNRQKLLIQLLTNPKALPLIEKQLYQFPWDCDQDEELKIEVYHLVNALTMLQSGEITMKAAANWADCILMREDILIEDKRIGEILVEIANYYEETLPKQELQKYLTVLNTSD